MEIKTGTPETIAQRPAVKEDDIDWRFVASEQGHFDNATSGDEIGHPFEGGGNGAQDALLEIEVLAAVAL